MAAWAAVLLPFPPVRTLWKWKISKQKDGYSQPTVLRLRKSCWPTIKSLKSDGADFEDMVASKVKISVM